MQEVTRLIGLETPIQINLENADRTAFDGLTYTWTVWAKKKKTDSTLLIGPIAGTMAVKGIVNFPIGSADWAKLPAGHSVFYVCGVLAGETVFLQDFGMTLTN
jgi:hypothetical protein